ncbi:hypothetical protein C8Q80DRAFT_1295239 [Daedaleopsis nitida]|nr:hypothetical protein C8Q80DRAFT_1295239 [Daedaleopsis nitida]
MSTAPGSALAVPGPNKRPRQTEPGEEEAHVQQGLKVRRDHEIWLEDGNVILIANDVAFKVYQGILSRHSEVFRDLFTLPSPSEGDMLYGVPAVRVHDSPEDIRPLLLVLCCGKNYYARNDIAIPIDFSVLSALVRMGHKYAIPDVLDHGLARLQQQYPSHYLSYRYIGRHKLVASRPRMLSRRYTSRA